MKQDENNTNMHKLRAEGKKVKTGNNAPNTLRSGGPVKKKVK